jgi:hypothetical protein
VASVAVFGVGLVAFSASAKAAPPVIQTCTPKPSTGSDSCVRGKVAALDGGIGSTLERVRVGIRTRSTFDPASDETTSVTLRFDENIALNLSGIPSCPSSELVNKNVAQAWEQCGPGADGSPASEGNAYLSTGLGNNVSGIGSSVPDGGGAVACTMIFKGADNNHVTLFARAPANTSGCDNPATNTGGTTTVLFPGSLTRQPTSSPYDWTLTVSNTQTADPALDDFYATIVRGDAFRARCPNPTYKHKIVGIFDYTSTPTDTIAPPYPGTVADESACGGPPEPPPNARPNTKITKAKVKQRRHKATFEFKATGGEATSFQCKLKRKGHKAKGFKRCSSPKTYKHLKRGKYSFEVRAVGPGGKDRTPAKKSFRIKRQGR